MSAYSFLRIAQLTKCIRSDATTMLCRTNVLNRVQACGYAKKVAAKGKGKGMMKEQLNGPEVCKDPVKLTSYAVGANILKQGEDPKLKPTEEYPEWLFQLNLGTAQKLNELEPDTWQYWKRLRKENIWRSNKLSKGKKF
ncbi:large ribosomal subunit protein mL54 [Parambassis ranga]|uniref:Large ribosomal subunit protein mL54 n=1 Tax=Parambassis ranga TaxID=210632 RepID=A0A6P7I612_9TELE|nr:39S ribosomal protein L54, mitochondrial [Parambassis ranga]